MLAIGETDAAAVGEPVEELLEQRGAVVAFEKELRGPRGVWKHCLQLETPSMGADIALDQILTSIEGKDRIERRQTERGQCRLECRRDQDVSRGPKGFARMELVVFDRRI